MTAQELAAKPAKEVRNSNELMELYIEEYTALFGKAPNCAACTFKNDFTRFQQAVKSGNSQRLTQNTITMKTTFKLKNKYRNNILTYREDKRPRRSYGYKMTEEFAREFLSKGTKKELEARAEMFETLPEDEYGKTVNPTVKPPKPPTEPNPDPADKDSEDEVKDEDLKLTELREKYPDIKARSKAEFLKEIE